MNFYLFKGKKKEKKDGWGQFCEQAIDWILDY